MNLRLSYLDGIHRGVFAEISQPLERATLIEAETVIATVSGRAGVV